MARRPRCRSEGRHLLAPPAPPAALAPPIRPSRDPHRGDRDPAPSGRPPPRDSRARASARSARRPSQNSASADRVGREARRSIWGMGASRRNRPSRLASPPSTIQTSLARAAALGDDGDGGIEDTAQPAGQHRDAVCPQDRVDPEDDRARDDRPPEQHRSRGEVHLLLGHEPGRLGVHAGQQLRALVLAELVGEHGPRVVGRPGLVDHHGFEARRDLGPLLRVAAPQGLERRQAQRLAQQLPACAREEGQERELSGRPRPQRVGQAHAAGRGRRAAALARPSQGRVAAPTGRHRRHRSAAAARRPARVRRASAARPDRAGR